jgi:hypothetical protein
MARCLHSALVIPSICWSGPLPAKVQQPTAAFAAFFAAFFAGFFFAAFFALALAITFDVFFDTFFAEAFFAEAFFFLDGFFIAIPPYDTYQSKIVEKGMAIAMRAATR